MRTPGPLIAAIVLLVGGAWGRAAADDETYDVTAARVGPDEAIVVDGVPDEEAWGRAPVIDSFTGSRPTEGFEPRGETRARILTDDTHLYVFFEARFDERTRVRAYFSEREDINADDQVAINIDPFGDGRRVYMFWMNALGVQQDILATLGGAYNPAWDAIFKSRGRTVDGGYDVEIAIPFRSLRFDQGYDGPWGIQLKRKFSAHEEYVAWPPVHRDDGPEFLQYGKLHGLTPGSSGIGLELQPTVTVRTGQDRDEETDELVWRKPGFPDTVDPGLGIKWQVTPSLTLDAAVNPDFSQVEADPNQVDNNRRFALYLPERRPFFLEGRELFNGYMLYSRSIVDPIYGLKFSGKQGPVSVAVLHALDEAPSASVVGEHDTPGFMEEDVDGALAFVSHAEARFDLGQRSNIAVSFADKELLRDGRHHAQFHALNVDGRYALDENSQIDAAVAYSTTGRVGEELMHGAAWFSEYGRGVRLSGFGFGQAGSTEGMRVENGFITRPGIQEFWSWGHHKIELPGAVEWVQAGANINAGLEGVGSGSDPAPSWANATAWAGVRLPGLTDVRVTARHWDSLFEGKDFQGGTVSFNVSNRALEWIQGNVSAGFGDVIHFDDASQTILRRVGGNLAIRGLRRLHLDVSTSLNVVGRDDEEIDRLWIWRAKTTVGITRALSVRVIVQGRDQTILAPGGAVLERDDSIDLSALVTLVPSPGTAVHVGFGERWTWAHGDTPRTERRDLFLKASLLIRL